MASPGTLTRPELDAATDLNRGGWIVIVFNNEVNTWEEVVSILMLATKCSLDEAEMETWEIDRLGKSVVHIAGKEECETVASVVSRIGIQVEVSEG